MDAKHTPGPWWATDYGVRDRGGYIAHMNSVQRYPGQDERYTQEVVQREADKRLIAAAPDLLEALQEMVDGDADAIDEAKALGVPFPEEMLKAYRKAISAIAKATGGQT